ncbi:alpha/beta-hydrolase [Aspergillus californicus]
MATPNITAILIIHGAYFLPSGWDSFIAALRRKHKDQDLSVECPRLPSCGDSQPPTATLADDVSAVRVAAEKLIGAGHRVAVLAHSYGGVVASEAITPDLYVGAQPDHDRGIASLILLSAFLVQPGDSLPGILGKYGFQSKMDLGDNGDGSVFTRNALDSFYNDLPRAKGEELAEANVTHNSTAAFGVVTGAPWKVLPTVYVYLTADLAIYLPLQKSMVADAVGAGGKIQVETLDAGHCPFLSRPDEFLDILLKVIGGV